MDLRTQSSIRHFHFFCKTIYRLGYGAGYINGKVVNKQVIRAICCKENRDFFRCCGRQLTAGSDDAVFVSATITDENGTVIPNADHLITFEVIGPGDIIGPREVMAEAGIATVFMRGGSKPGKIKINATSESVGKATYQLNVRWNVQKRS